MYNVVRWGGAIVIGAATYMAASVILAAISQVEIATAEKRKRNRASSSNKRTDRHAHIHTPRRPAHLEFPLISEPGPCSREGEFLYELLYEVCDDTLKERGVEHRVCCSFCNDGIYGVAYVCAYCTSIYLCERCEREHMHDDTHVLYKMKYRIDDESVLPRCQIPWTLDSNRQFLKTNPVSVSLTYDQVERLKSRTYDLLSASEIEALYEQFRCLVDCAVKTSNNIKEASAGLSSTTLTSTSASGAAALLGSHASSSPSTSPPRSSASSPGSTGASKESLSLGSRQQWNFIESIFSGYNVKNSKEITEEFASLGAISRATMIQILPTRYSSISRLQDFLLSEVYDCDKDGIISFPDYVCGTSLVTNSNGKVKLEILLRYLADQNASRDIAIAKGKLRELFLSHMELGHRAFADALHLQKIESELDRRWRSSQLSGDQSGKNTLSATTTTADPTSQTTKPINEIHNNNNSNNPRKSPISLDPLWDDRTEFDSWTSFNSEPIDERIETEFVMAWDEAVERLVDEMFKDISIGPTTEYTDQQVRMKWTSSSAIIGCISSLYEAGII